MAEGLDRHEAIHAIGSLVSEQIFNVLKHDRGGGELNSEYEEKLKRLTVESWRNQFK